MSLKIGAFFHQPIPEMVKRIADRVDPKWEKVVEVGPGFLPFPKANILVEKPPQDTSIAYPTQSYKREGIEVVYLDANIDPLPFEDDEIDFIYCRHVIEDMYNPGQLLREMSRVAKRGYVETPTPIAEWARHIDLPDRPCPWRGYSHHRYFVWEDAGDLVLIPKYPLVEAMDLGPMEDTVTSVLATGPIAWHTRHFWEGALRYRMMEHESGFQLGAEYQRLIVEGLQKSLQSSQVVWESVFADDGAAVAP